MHVRSQRTEWLVLGGLPWFLTPLQPQGFLGRELARWRPDFPADPEGWHTLLHLEKLALDALGEQGVAHADTQVLEPVARIFLL